MEKARINLFYNYYVPENPERKKEIDYCLHKNLNNKYVDKIFLLTETEIEINNPKVIKRLTDKRTTFEDAYNFIRDCADKNDINIIINSDCYIEEDDMPLLDKLKPNGAWALTRWDIVDQNFNAIRWTNAGSQDCWIFRLEDKVLDDMDYYFGIMACDNRFQSTLWRNKYEVVNPSKTFRVYHYHLSRYRTYDWSYRLPLPPGFLDVPITELS